MATIGGRAGRYVSGPDWRIALVEQLFRAIERLWCWREFSLPAIAVGVAYKAGHPGLAFMAGTLLVCILVLLLLTHPRVVIGALLRCRARSHALSRQISWPRICRDLGWGRRLEHGAMLVPELVSWSENERQVTMQVRPLPEHGGAKLGSDGRRAPSDGLRRDRAMARVAWNLDHRHLASGTAWQARLGLRAL